MGIQGQIEGQKPLLEQLFKIMEIIIIFIVSKQIIFLFTIKKNNQKDFRINYILCCNCNLDQNK